MKKQLLPIILLSLVNALSFSMLFTVLPYIVEEYVGDPDEHTLKYALTVGVLLSSYSVFQFFASPILGELSDKYGRKPILMITQFGTALSWVIFCVAYVLPDSNILAISLPIWVIGFSRVVDGITGGNFSVANAFASDISTPAGKSKVFGLLGGTFGAGLIIGPVLGGWTNSTEYGYLATGLFGAVLSFITLLVMGIYLPESLDKESRNELDAGFLKKFNIIGKVRNLDNKFLEKMFITRLFFSLVFTSYVSIITLFAKDSYDLSSLQLGFVFLIIGLYLVFNQTFLVKLITDKIGDLKANILGTVLFFVGLPMIIFAVNVYVYLAIAYILNVGISLCMISFKSIVSNSVERKRQGEILGLDESFHALGRSISPIIATIIYGSLLIWSFPVFALGLLPALGIFLSLKKGE